LGSKLNTLRTDRLQKEALVRQMQSAPNPNELPEVMRSMMVQSLRNEQSALESRLTQLQERYLDEHPEVIKTRRQLDDIKRRIAAEAQAVIRSVQNEYKAT